jgi:hypothetical protein
LLRREREVQSLAPINVKRVYRVMRDHNLLLERRIAYSLLRAIRAVTWNGCNDVCVLAYEN